MEKICSTHDEIFILRGERLRCRSCQIEAQKRHYRNHHEIEVRKRRKQLDALKSRNREIVIEAKNKPCTDCGKEYPHYVMHFDHLRDKKDNVSQMLTHATQMLLEEIEKCEVVCANCHAERTWKRASLV